jgi:hypothetical protein
MSDESQPAISAVAGRLMLLAIEQSAMRILEQRAGTEDVRLAIPHSTSLLEAIIIEKITLRPYKADKAVKITVEDVER